MNRNSMIVAGIDVSAWLLVVIATAQPNWYGSDMGSSLSSSVGLFKACIIGKDASLCQARGTSDDDDTALNTVAIICMLIAIIVFGIAAIVFSVGRFVGTCKKLLLAPSGLKCVIGAKGVAFILALVGFIVTLADMAAKNSDMEDSSTNLSVGYSAILALLGAFGFLASAILSVMLKTGAAAVTPIPRVLVISVGR